LEYFGTGIDMQSSQSSCDGYNSIMLTLAILAGGKSKRMGRNKAIIPFQGEALVYRVMERLEGLADEVIVVAPRTKEYLSLGVKIFKDVIPGYGPLGGLYTALLAASQPAIAVVACDMPFVNFELLAYEKEILFKENFDVVVPISIRGLEPLHAIYRRGTCLQVVKEAIKIKERRMISWYPLVKVRILSAEEIRPYDPDEMTFLNINTPEELVKIEKLASTSILSPAQD
jgi:molybdopterin-guanine dinucleotide biosynthesis protein A